MSTTARKGVSTSAPGMLVHDHDGVWHTGIDFADHHGHYARILWGILGRGTFSAVLAASRVFLTPFQAEYTITVDRILHVNRNPSVGNFRQAIYADGGDTPVGGALLVESASTLTTGVDRKQELTIADLQLTPGLYWLALNKDTAGDNLNATHASYGRGGTLTGFSFAHAYGAFPNPCPAAATYINTPIMGVRVKSVP